jgi:hypothetical protein
VAGAILSNQFVVCVSKRGNLEAMADGWMKFLHRRLNAHALGLVHAKADEGALAAADGSRSGVKVQNLEAIASQ